MKRERKSKILSTLGPATSDIRVIKKLFISGTDIFRLNFSHGSIEDHRNNYNLIRKVEQEVNRPICVIADLQGPKLRIGEFKDKKIELKKTENFILDLDKSLGDNTRVCFPHPEVYSSLTPNTKILINDGKIVLQVLNQDNNKVITEIINDGFISNNKGVNIPDIELPISSITLKDKTDFRGPGATSCYWT